MATRAETDMMLTLWKHWAEKVDEALGEGVWAVDDTAMTAALLSLFQEGKTPEEAVACIRKWEDKDD